VPSREDGSVETPGDFEQAVLDSGVMDWLMDSAPDTAPEVAVDTGGADARPRDEQGRFVAAQAEEEEAQPEDSTEEVIPADVGTEPEAEEDDDEIVLEIDDDLASVLERYDGDVGKALKALAEKESFTGRQANEIGQLRQELAALREDLQKAPQQPQYVGPYRHDLDEPKELVLEALERGDTQTMELAIRAWGEEEPFEAAAFLFSLSAQNQTEAEQPQQEPVAPQGVGQSIEAAMADVVERHPDVEKHLPALGQVAQEFPTLRNFMQQGTPAQQAQAFEELLVITKSRSSQADTSSSMKRVILKTQEEVRNDKAEAAVLSAQTQSAATAKSPIEEFYRQFEEATGQVGGDDWITRSND
jgi:hypothetical protein